MNVAQYTILTFLLFGALATIAWLLTTFIHELGHAVPALLITRKPVSVYIGSHGDEKHCLRIKTSIITAWVKYNPATWYKGQCRYETDNLTARRNIVIILGGPIASTLLAAMACYFTFSGDWHGFLKLFFFIFLISALADLALNLYPRAEAINSFNGTITYNDGQLLKLAMQELNYPKEYFTGYSLFHQQQYIEAADYLERAVEKDQRFPVIFRLAIAARVLTGEAEKAWPVHEIYASKFTLLSSDLSMAGLMKESMGHMEEAKNAHDAAIATDPENAVAWHNRGYYYRNQTQYQEALADFDMTLSLEPGDVLALCHRCELHLRLGNLDNARQDAERVLTIHPDHPDALLYLGKYYENSGDKENALASYLKVKSISPDADDIDTLISGVQ